MTWSPTVSRRDRRRQNYQYRVSKEYAATPVARQATPPPPPAPPPKAHIVAYVHGAGRWMSTPWAYGAVAACFPLEDGNTVRTTKRLPNRPPKQKPDTFRVAIEAVILALEVAMRWRDKRPSVKVDVTICSDSKYVIDAMTENIWKWSKRHWNIDEGGN